MQACFTGFWGKDGILAGECGIELSARPSVVSQALPACFLLDLAPHASPARALAQVLPCTDVLPCSVCASAFGGLRRICSCFGHHFYSVGHVQGLMTVHSVEQVAAVSAQGFASLQLN